MAGLAHLQDRSAEVRAEYDRAVDVLHLMRGGPPVPVEGDGLPNGIELVYSADDGAPCGVTVLGFRRHGWNRDPGALAQIAADHLGLSRRAALKAIAAAVK